MHKTYRPCIGEEKELPCISIPDTVFEQQFLVEAVKRKQ
jgi:hypothetical protein